MKLNKIYYNKLIRKYSSNEVSYITVGTIMDNYSIRNVYYNFPDSYDFKVIINLIYEKLSKDIFANYAEITDYSVGYKLKRNGEKGKNIYTIIKIENAKYTLLKLNDSSNTIIPNVSFDRLKTNYTQIIQSARNKTLQTFITFFDPVNKYGFTPQHFSKKLVLIAGKTLYDKLQNRNCIPSVYLPNSREEEQTAIKSIPALEDCIAYITPKYEVCYEEILKKNIVVDTIIVCATDLCSLSQIIQDQSIYKFKLIILSNESELQKPNMTTLWDWQKEEIELLEQKDCNKIEVDCFENEYLDNHIQHFEECMKYVSSFEYPIKLKSYGYYLRSALNYIQEEQFDYLLYRIKRDKELERNEGGYENFADKNPKEALKNLIYYLKEYNPKKEKLQNIIQTLQKNILLVADRENVDMLKSIRNDKCKVITNAELKKILRCGEKCTKTIVYYSFNGARDFDLICNLPYNVRLILYKQENDLYRRQLQNYTKQLETELMSTDRFTLCGIKYEQIVEQEIKVSPTLEQIIAKLEQRSNTAYDGYKNESESLLDDLEEKSTYKVTFTNNSEIEIESYETVFDTKGDLIHTYRLKPNSKIRIYPKEQFAEKLFQIAVEVESNKFGKIDEHSNCWKNILKALDIQYFNRATLYQKLKENGLRVLPVTVDSYFRGNRKFPMYNSDLKAILLLANKENLLPEIKKSKRLYNSTMIALGRGVKQELQQFLKEKTIGEILQKKDFTAQTLQQFINEHMPLLTITKIEEISDEQ